MNARAETDGQPAGGLLARLTIALAGVGLAVCGWFAPSLCAPAAAMLCAIFFLTRRRRGAGETTGLAIAAGLTAMLCVKDLLTGGPIGWATVELGIALGWTPRQPDTAAACAAAAAVGIAVLVFHLLRTDWSDGVGPRAWGRAVAAVSAVLAAGVLTAPHAARDYGDGFHVGEVASRNAAAGAFALAAMVAGGLVIDALRAGRSREWPLAAAAAGVCAAAAASLGSRGGLVALLAGAMYFVARVGERRARGWVLSAGALLIGAMLIAPGTVARLGAWEGEYRLELWSASMRVWLEAPLGGVGGGGFADAFALFSGVLPVEGARVIHPDSSWVLIWTEWGSVGVAVVVAAGWLLLRRGVTRRAASGISIGAEAGLVVWAVAAIGDVSFHRAVTLVIGLPLLAIVWPGDTPSRQSRAPTWTKLIGATLALVLACMVVWDRAGPLDGQVNHERGFAALSAADTAGAAKHFTAVVAVDPANTAALQLYARALMPNDPERALPLWRRLFVAAGPRASVFLNEELRRDQSVTLSYWMRAVETLPEMWVLLADRDELAAQQYFERWRTASEEARARSPLWAVLGALARWGNVADVLAWMTASPDVPLNEALHGARFLNERGRRDLAWTWLAGALPDPAGIAGVEPDAGLRARVRANPGDFVAAARLLAQTESADERLGLLRQWSVRAEAPAWFRIRLAHTLHAAGQREEAFTLLLDAAESMRRAQGPGHL